MIASRAREQPPWNYLDRFWLLGVPEGLISFLSWSESSRGLLALGATFSLCTWCRMSSTISGLASVVTSPTSVKLEIDGDHPAHDLPGPGLGHVRHDPHVLRPGDLADLGLDRLGDLVLDLVARREAGLERDVHLDDPAADVVDRPGPPPPRRPRRTVSAADSISLVPSRCPATLITSSTRPRIRK